jgi:DNA-binding response OmpR family regulator
MAVAKIFVVDDDEKLLALVRDGLEAFGHEVQAFSNPNLALQAITQEPPELCLVDVMMPEVDGLTFLQLLKIRDGKTTPVVLMSARREYQIVRAGLRLGALDYLTKPFRLAELRSVIDRALIEAKQEETQQRYERRHLVGYGANADVYLAHDRVQDQDVALKYHRPHLPASSLARVAREYDALSNIRHPNIVRVFAHGIDGNSPYLVMEYVQGVNLADWLRNQASTTSQGVASALYVFTQVVEALIYLHESNFVHRDIKPDNIQVRFDGTVKLLDFGLIKVLSPEFSELNRLTTSDQLLGTLVYMPPEQLRGEEISPASDLYALGVMMYEAFTGYSPFGTTLMAILNKLDKVIAPNLRTPHLDTKLSELIVGLLESDPKKRPTGVETLAVLKHLQGE